jgi:oxalate decarboxylase/phosphoglucose isomerase-like protein (cupin superfamily)
MQTIKHENKILSIIYRDDDWTEGLNFITPNELFVQVGSWWYDKGKKLASHIHNDFERKAMRTQEMVYVKKGSMRVLLYDEDKNYLQDYILYEGDLAVFAYGGHGYEILDDGTKIIEAKNGPFVDVDTDKTKF